MVGAAIEWNEIATAIDRPNLIDRWISVAIKRLRMTASHQPVYHYGQQRGDYSWKIKSSNHVEFAEMRNRMIGAIVFHLH